MVVRGVGATSLGLTFITPPWAVLMVVLDPRMLLQ